MTIASEITRLTGLRNRIRTKLAALGLGSVTDKLDDCADEIEGIGGTEYLTDTSIHDVAGKQYANVRDNNLVAGNIVSGVTILGVTGTANVQPPQANLQQGYLYYGGVNAPSSLYPSQGYDGFSQVIVELTDASPALISQNIRNGRTIMGVNGTYETPTQAKSPTLAELVAVGITSHSVDVLPTSPNHLSQVTIPQITAAVDSNIVAGNIKSGVSILGVNGTYDFGVSALTSTGSGGVSWDTPRESVTIDINVPHTSSFKIVSISGYNYSMSEHELSNFVGKISSFYITSPSSGTVECVNVFDTGAGCFLSARGAACTVSHYALNSNTRVSIILANNNKAFMGTYIVSVVYKT